jgi:hypothetical protein
MTENIIRKSTTGESGNRGEFGTHSRPESGVTLQVSDRELAEATDTPTAVLSELRDKTLAKSQLLRAAVEGSYSAAARELGEQATELMGTGLIAGGRVLNQASDGRISEAEGRLMVAAENEDGGYAWRYGISYWDRVATTRDPNTSASTLAMVLARESEDDFMLAIAGHPNAAADQIERASQHHSTAVRMAALDNSNTATATLVRIENQAMAEELEAAERLRREGVSPMQKHIASEVASASALSSYARARIAARG